MNRINHFQCIEKGLNNNQKYISYLLIKRLKEIKKLIGLHLLFGGNKIQYSSIIRALVDKLTNKYSELDKFAGTYKTEVSIDYFKYCYSSNQIIGPKEHQILTLLEFDFNENEILKIVKCSNSYLQQIKTNWNIPNCWKNKAGE